VKIVVKNVDDLIPYARNSRTHSEEQVLQIASSIREFGFNNPVLIDQDGGIIAGHGRVLAARKVGISEVPTIELSHLTDTQKKAYVIADNKIALNAGWDEEMLKLELEELKLADFDIDLTGFSDEEFNLLMDEHEPQKEGLTDDDAIPELTEDPVSKQGDIWILGNHRVMCGDSTSIDDIEKLMDGEIADMVFTDPPYGISIVSAVGKVDGGGVPKFGKVGGSKVVDAKDYPVIIGDDTTQTARDFYSTCLSAGFENFIIWGGNYFTDFLTPSHCWLVWDKKNTGNFADVELAWCSLSKSAKLYSHLWNGMSREGDHKTELSTRVHPTQKPVGLFVQIFSDFEFDSVFDGFLGSGSTLVACEKTGKTCYGIEMSANYIDVIVKRWQDFTGKDAVLESTGLTFNNYAK